MHKILIIAGEASGDLLGAQLHQSLKRKNTTIDCFGMGGELMQQAGVNILIHCNDLAVIGGLEVAKHFKKIRYAYKTIKKTIKERQPDLIILIDYPDFNLRIAKFAKKNGCKVFYYVSPQIWAWRYYRIHHIKKYVDRMAVLFSFEEKIYQNANVPVRFVGHPIIDVVKTDMDSDTARQSFNIKTNGPIIGLFPGSRLQEIARMLPILIEALPPIRKQFPNAQFILPLANSLSKSDIPMELPADVQLVENNTYNALSIMDAAIAVSGTVTLEIALQKVPLVVIYKMSPLTFHIAKLLIKISHVALCNIVAETEVAKELLQNDTTPTNIANEVKRLISDSAYRKNMIENFNLIQKNLGQGGASDRTADAVLELLSIYN